MSFILDALRKSEHERQRAAMPGIAQVPFGLPRREMPVWALGLIAALVLALLTLAGVLWRSTWPDAARDRTASAPVRNEIPLAVPAATPSSVPPPSETPAAAASTVTQAAETPVAARPSSELRESEATVPAAQPPAASPTATSSVPRASAPAADEMPDRTGAKLAAAERPDHSAAEPSTSEQTLPSASALVAQGVNVPRLHLELHAYAARPADRFVFINGTKYAEGATLAEGPKLVAIAPNGAILSYLGHRFLLAPQ
jgi:general secretion pathway protein B